MIGCEMMCELAKSQTKPHNTEIMLPDNLHCMSHVVWNNSMKKTGLREKKENFEF